MEFSSYFVYSFSCCFRLVMYVSVIRELWAQISDLPLILAIKIIFLDNFRNGVEFDKVKRSLLKVKPG